MAVHLPLRPVASCTYITRKAPQSLGQKLCLGNFPPEKAPSGLLYNLTDFFLWSKLPVKSQKNVEPESRGIETLRENWSETAELEFIFSPRCDDAIGI
jgi:hypothetical protein